MSPKIKQPDIQQSSIDPGPCQPDQILTKFIEAVAECIERSGLPEEDKEELRGIIEPVVNGRHKLDGQRERVRECLGDFARKMMVMMFNGDWYVVYAPWRMTCGVVTTGV